MPLVALLSGNLLRYPLFFPFRLPPRELEIEVGPGRFRLTAPFTHRAACLFLGALAMAREGDLRCSTYRLLRSIDLKLYREDFLRLLEKLSRARYFYEGSFFAGGRFVSRRELGLFEELRPPAGGSPLEVSFPDWVRAEPFPVDVGLFRRLSPVAARLYLYFTFALSRGAFEVSAEHLARLLPVLTARQEASFRRELPAALERLAEAGVLTFEDPGNGIFVVSPGPLLSELKTHLPARPKRKGSAARPSPNLLFVGRGHCGKSTILRRLAERARQRGRPVLFFSCLYAVSDWLAENFPAERLKGLGMVEKRRLLLEEAGRSFVVVDDLERATAQKTQLVKECLARAPRFAASCRIYREVPEAVRLVMERKGFREVPLRSRATKDLTFALMAGLVLLAAVSGHYEWVFALLAARFIMRQPL